MMSHTNLRNKNSVIPSLRNDSNHPVIDLCKMGNSPTSPLVPTPDQIGPPRPHKKTMECFRTDLITNMKLPDNAHLEPGAYATLQDQWRHTWEKGVQVPTATMDQSGKREERFRLNQLWPPPDIASSDDRPKKYIHDSGRPVTSSYSLDDLDASWLELAGPSKGLCNHTNAYKNTHTSPSPELLRQCLISLEHTTYRNMAHAIRTQEELGIQYDDEVACDVCGELEAQEGNELVFCDYCNVCVHQLCYGVPDVPEGPWLCAPCLKTTLNNTHVSLASPHPNCHLCPSPPGGALKSSQCGKFWVHVSCARWIPELGLCLRNKTRLATSNKRSQSEQVDLGKINSSRWNLICSICRIRKGACIQCSEPHCVTAFHASCACKNNLEMFQTPSGLRQVFCSRHRSLSKSDRASSAPSASKLVEMEEEFDSYADPTDLKHLRLSSDLSQLIFNYWCMKRRANHCKPLVSESLLEVVKPDQQKFDTSDLRRSVSSYNTDATPSPPGSPPRKAKDPKIKRVLCPSRDVMNEKKLYKLRLDLEKARNLSYMICRREKIKRQLIDINRNSLEIELRLVGEQDERDMSTPEEYKARYANESYTTCRITRARSLDLLITHSNES